VTGSGRILGIDPGERRVGLAVSDLLGITAQGLDTFDLKTGGLIQHLQSLKQELDITLVVLGHPLSMSGRANESSKKAESLARKIEKNLQVKVVLWDERLTSVEAGRVVAGSRARKGSIDKVAAVLILQGYMDSITR